MRRFVFVAALALHGCSRKEASESASAPASAVAAGDTVASGEPVVEDYTTERLPGSMRSAVDSLDRGQAVWALEEATKLFDSTLALGQVDCPLAELLRDRICELAERICSLEAEENVLGSSSRCESSRSSCRSARRRVTEQCG